VRDLFGYSYFEQRTVEPQNIQPQNIEGLNRCALSFKLKNRSFDPEALDGQNSFLRHSIFAFFRVRDPTKMKTIYPCIAAARGGVAS